MTSSYEYAYLFEEALGTGAFSALFSTIPSGLFGIATYVLTSLALYCVALRRGLNRPWLAWIPVVNCWIIGSLSDQYRYVVKGEVKSKRKVLLTLNILTSVLSMVMTVVVIVMIVKMVNGAMLGISDSQMFDKVLGSLVGILGLALPMLGIGVTFAVIRYMALYDIYRSMDPANCVVFLVLSILFNITEPFFLFFNRNKDLGMPPRRQQPYYVPQEPQWQAPMQENQEYL